MLFSSKFRQVALTSRLLKTYQQRTTTSSASPEEGGNGPEPPKLRMFSDPDDRRGYKYDGTLDLTALIDKGSAMGYINTADADGFKARNFRTGAEPPDPEKAKEIMVFFKNRAKPTTPVKKNDHYKRSLHESKDTTLGRPKETETPTRFRIPPNAQHPTRQTAVMRKMHAQPNYNGAPSSGPTHPTPRGNYKLSKPQKK